METSKSTFVAIRPVIPLAVATLIFYSAQTMTVPFMVDVLLGAICYGHSECSQVIIMMAAQQLIAGICSIMAGPILGNLSDKYGRKPVLLVCHLAGIIPAGILAYSRDEAAVYRWWVAWTFMTILIQSSLQPTIFAYVADAVDQTHRAAGIGLTSASSSVGFLMGTVVTYFINTAGQAYTAGTIAQISSTVYLILFVTETNPRQSLLPDEERQSEATTKLLAKPQLERETTSLLETFRTVWNSPLLRITALVDFMCIFGTTGVVSFTLYYLRSVFIFDKDQFATIMAVGSLSRALGQMLFYPVLSYTVGQRAIVWIGLIGSIVHYLFYSFAWSPWLPYLAISTGGFLSFIDPAVATISSRGVDQEQQGKLQGVFSSIRSLGGIVAPLVLTPLTAAALGDNPPLDMRGLPYLVCGGITILALVLSLRLPYIPISEDLDNPTEYIQAPTPPEDFIPIIPPQEFLHVPMHPEVVRRVESEGSEQDEKSIAQPQYDPGSTSY